MWPVRVCASFATQPRHLSKKTVAHACIWVCRVTSEPNSLAFSLGVTAQDISVENERQKKVSMCSWFLCALELKMRSDVLGFFGHCILSLLTLY